MYRNCIFCSAALGANDSLEEFPVGRILAFDGWKGRLWAVCPRCHRWNLAPIETRWEAVERAEVCFRGSGHRVQAERIGLAQLRDGTRLVRVGEALPGELAAWRYGRELRERRRRYWMELGVSFIVAGVPWLPAQYRRREVVCQLPAEAAPHGRELLLRRFHLDGAEFRGSSERDGMSLRVRRHRRLFGGFPELEIGGAAARTALERTLVGVNQRGASRRDLEGALQVLDRGGPAEAYAERLALGADGDGDQPGVLRIRERMRTGHFRCEWRGSGGPASTRIEVPRVLALEMALHEESERRALKGELAELEARWREAEEIAQIADAL